jgi:hypothetical protein
MAIALSVLPFTLLSGGLCCLSTAIRKKGKWKDRQHKPPERRGNGRTDNAIAIRKNGKWKDRQYNNHQKEE